ncbi:MAG: HAD family hydrolase [Acidobacteria bacterium]|nr:HAD family hydrolase [Acidobacteriota bacterium]MBS1864942.1 HAD family hydrolase [Acidobacteriota bacterium]
MSTRAVFLDRDGVINRKAPEGQYITRWEEMELLPGVVHAIQQFGKAGFKIVVVTNQRCVAKGLLTPAELEELHRRLTELLASHGAVIDAIYYCPHEKSDGCSCRKPAPGMLLVAAREHGISLKESWMVGDSPSDLQAGKSAGCKTALVTTHQQSEVGTGISISSEADLVGESLLEVTQQILCLSK